MAAQLSGVLGVGLLPPPDRMEPTANSAAWSGVMAFFSAWVI
jgi:hypothetical protein